MQSKLNMTRKGFEHQRKRADLQPARGHHTSSSGKLQIVTGPQAEHSVINRVPS